MIEIKYIVTKQVENSEVAEILNEIDSDDEKLLIKTQAISE